MNDMPDASNPGSADSTVSEIDKIPVADVTPSRLETAAEVTGTYMWLIAVVCLVIAVGLVWWSLPERGIAIYIHFPEGHGLEAEDAVRFRGIDVGTVEEVKLNEELSGVDVRVNLNPTAEALAREGTRFWIVRPELSLAGISGLDTAVGHKYIGLIPGDPDAPFKRTFEGLASSPPDALANEGLEIIVRGPKKYSVNAGSPVTCRGVEIGRILSVGLSQDARFVDIRARIFDKHTRLVTSKTKFWATSGVDVDFTIGGGIKLDMESLETIARGGISMLTTENGGQPVKPGHVFTPLYQKPEEDWYKNANLVVATDVELRGALPLELQWQHDGFLGQSKKQLTFTGVPFKSGAGETFALIPADVLAEPSKAVPETLKLAPIFGSKTPIPVENSSSKDDEGSAVKKQLIPESFSKDWLNQDATREPEKPEDCLVVRASDSNGGLTYLHYPVESSEMAQDDDGNWILIAFDGDREVWHGAPVLSATDGKLIGILLIGRRQTRIIRFQPSMIL